MKLPVSVPPNWPETRDREMIRATYSQIRLDPEQAGMVFYGRLFEIAPHLRGLFPDKLNEQARKLMQTLKILVESLDRLDTLLPVIRDLGRRHRSYGAMPDHYAAVGSALVWTLQQALGTALTEEAKEDWILLYTLVSREMEKGAAEPEPVPSV